MSRLTLELKHKRGRCSHAREIERRSPARDEKAPQTPSRRIALLFAARARDSLLSFLQARLCRGRLRLAQKAYTDRKPVLLYVYQCCNNVIPECIDRMLPAIDQEHCNQIIGVLKHLLSIRGIFDQIKKIALNCPSWCQKIHTSI